MPPPSLFASSASRVVQFTAYGKCEPQGSARAVPLGGKVGGRPMITSDNPRLKSWRGVLAAAAGEAMQQAKLDLLESALVLTVTFVLQRPKSAPKRVTHPTKRPDLDKLLRSFDGLTGVVWRDDSQVVEIFAMKIYDTAGVPPGAIVTVREAL